MDLNALADSSAACWNRLYRGLNRIANDNVSRITEDEATHPDYYGELNDFLDMLLVDRVRDQAYYALVMAKSASDRAHRARA